LVFVSSENEKGKKCQHERSFLPSSRDKGKEAGNEAHREEAKRRRCISENIEGRLRRSTREIRLLDYPLIS
jgi:hypothetical protein